MVRRAQPRLDAEDDVVLFGFRRDALQPAHDFRLAVGIVAQVPFLEERQQDDADVEGAGDIDAVADPLLGARVGLVGDLVHQVERDAANPHAVGGCRLAIRALHVRAAQLQVVVDAAHRDLHAVEAELLRDASAPRSWPACPATSRRRRC